MAGQSVYPLRDELMQLARALMLLRNGSAFPPTPTFVEELAAVGGALAPALAESDEVSRRLVAWTWWILEELLRASEAGSDEARSAALPWLSRGNAAFGPVGLYG